MSCAFWWFTEASSVQVKRDLGSNFWHPTFVLLLNGVKHVLLGKLSKSPLLLFQSHHLGAVLFDWLLITSRL